MEIQGTWIRGSVTKLWVRDADEELRAGRAAKPRSSPTAPEPLGLRLAGRAISNDQRRLDEPEARLAVAAVGERSAAVTVIRSPGLKGRAGEKALPWPAGWALRWPACSPLRDPTAVTKAIWPGEAAGKMTSVAGLASGAPGKGSTSRPWEVDFAWLDDAARRAELASATAVGPAPAAATSAGIKTTLDM